jgi:hypothetical protein
MSKVPPQIKYGNNRSFLSGKDGFMMPHDECHWDTSHSNANAIRDYLKIKNDRINLINH